MADLPAVGAEAPGFEAPTTNGERVSLDQYRGEKGVVLMFYPVDDTPGCTRQMCTARDERADFEAADVVRFGVNPGSLESHRAFVSKYELDFPLIVDEGGAIAEAYGVMGERGYPRRATVLVDRDGRIAFAEEGAHGADAVLGALRG